LFVWRSLAVLAALAAVLVALRGFNPQLGRSHLARLTVSGVVTDDRKLTEAVMKLADNDSVKALIVAIDSPGGSVAGGEGLVNLQQACLEQENRRAAGTGHVFRSMFHALGSFACAPDLGYRGPSHAQSETQRRTLHRCRKRFLDGRPAVDPLLDVIRTLTRVELNDAAVRKSLRVERILTSDRFDLLAAVADGQDDAAVARNFSARDQEVTRVVVLLQELHVNAHGGVELGERLLVDQFDDEHLTSINVI
jgi:hypothetical protein